MIVEVVFGAACTILPPASWCCPAPAKASDRISIGARYLSRHTVQSDELTLESEQIATGLRTPVPLPGIPQGTPVDSLLAPQFAAGGRLGGQGAATTLTMPDGVELPCVAMEKPVAVA